MIHKEKRNTHRFLQAANACRFWPTGRGIYHNDKKTFLVWVNEEDHLRIISMQNGGNVGQVSGVIMKFSLTVFCVKYGVDGNAFELCRFILAQSIKLF